MRNPKGKNEIVNCSRFLLALAVVTWLPNPCAQDTKTKLDKGNRAATGSESRTFIILSVLRRNFNLETWNMPFPARTEYHSLRLRGGGVSFVSNDASTIRKLERKLGGKEKVVRGAKRDGWDTILHGLDEVLAMEEDSQEKDPRKRSKMKSSKDQEMGDEKEPFERAVKAGRKLQDEDEGGRSAHVLPTLVPVLLTWSLCSAS